MMLRPCPQCDTIVEALVTVWVEGDAVRMCEDCYADLNTGEREGFYEPL